MEVSGHVHSLAALNVARNPGTHWIGGFGGPSCCLGKVYGENKSFSYQDLNRYPPAYIIVIIPTTLPLQPQANSGNGFIKYEGNGKNMNAGILICMVKTWRWWMRNMSLHTGYNVWKHKRIPKCNETLRAMDKCLGRTPNMKVEVLENMYMRWCVSWLDIWGQNMGNGWWDWWGTGEIL